MNEIAMPQLRIAPPKTEADMRYVASYVAAFSLAALTCAPLAAQRADSAVVGSWKGEAPITVSWTVHRALAVRLDIKEDGSVTGTVGDAQLLDGRIYSESRIARAMQLARHYAIEGRLNGCLIRAEGILRDRVRLSLDLTGQTLTGDLQTSGSYEGSISDRLLTASGFVLQRVDRTIARARRQEGCQPHGALKAAYAPTPG